MGACGHHDVGSDDVRLHEEGGGAADRRPSSRPRRRRFRRVPTSSRIVDEVVGTGAEARKDDRIKVHYTGTLMNGKMFDSSRGKDPFAVTVGAGQVIKGWDQGLPGMKVGGKRKLTHPVAGRVRREGQPAVDTAKAALKFDIELLEITTADDAGAKDAGPTPKAASKDAGPKK